MPILWSRAEEEPEWRRSQSGGGARVEEEPEWRRNQSEMRFG